jgi:hypothetical protein
LPATRTALALAASLTLLLQACANTPASPATVPVETSSAPGATAGSDTVPELTLNLPDPAECACTADTPADYTFLDKGFDALLDGEYIDAVQYFQRYQRLESSPRADWEAAIAIAYVSMLPRSPFYDPEAARSSFKELRKQNAKDLKVHDYTRLMRQSLLNFLIQEQHIEDLESTNATLKGDLEKREEALKRLRQLTLGQKGSAQ